MSTRSRIIAGTVGLPAAALAAAAVMLASGCLPKLDTRTPPVEATALAPEFDLQDADGATHRLRDLIADGPAVVVFYRGYW